MESRDRFEEQKQEADAEQEGSNVQQNDDFFYKIKELSKEKQQFIIEIPKTKKRYKIQFKLDSEYGFIGLPPEWERFIREMKVETKEIEKSPFEFLMTINFVATEGF